MRRREKEKLGWTESRSQSKWVRYGVHSVHVFMIVGGALGALLVDINHLSETRSILGVLLIVLSAVVSVSVQIWSDNRAAEYEKRRNKHITNFNDHLDGIIMPLLDLTSSDGSNRAASIFIDAVLGAGVHLFPEDGLRLCLYRLDTKDIPPEEQDKEPSYYLQLVSSRGRLDRPRLAFIPGEPGADHAINVALGHAPRPFSEIPEGDERFNRQQGSVWQSYMQFPLIGQKKNLGALMVDSREPVQWTQEHQAIGQTVAALLSHGLDLFPAAARDHRPELTSLKGVKGVQANLGSRLETGKEADHD